jgi:D-aminopeptidase
MIDGVPVGRELTHYKPVRRKTIHPPVIASEAKQSPTTAEITSMHKARLTTLASPPKADMTIDSGSVIVVIATDAPCSTRILTRLAMRAQNGLARTGSHTGNTSGDFVIAFSTTRRKKHFADALTYTAEQIIEQGDLINYMFWSVVEATEEAVLNSIFKADTMIGRDDHIIPGLPLEETVAVMKKYGHAEVHLP